MISESIDINQLAQYIEVKFSDNPIDESEPHFSESPSIGIPAPYTPPPPQPIPMHC